MIRQHVKAKRKLATATFLILRVYLYSMYSKIFRSIAYQIVGNVVATHESTEGSNPEKLILLYLGISTLLRFARS